jgi:hypothetical protein
MAERREGMDDSASDGPAEEPRPQGERMTGRPPPWEDQLLVSRPRPEDPADTIPDVPVPAERDPVETVRDVPVRERRAAEVPAPSGTAADPSSLPPSPPPNPNHPSNPNQAPNPGPGGAEPPGGVEEARGPEGEFAPDVTGRPVWRLLMRALAVYLPGWRQPTGALRVPESPSVRSSYGFGPPAYLNGDAGFGLQLAERRHGLEPDREIFVRGRENRTFGIVIAGPAAAVGTRVVDAARLLRYARRLTFEELVEPADPDSVPYAVRAARAVQNVVLLDRAAGVGLCAEVDAVTGAVVCPVFVRIGSPSERTVRAYGVAAQAVRSHS